MKGGLAYEITLLSVCLCIRPIVSRQRLGKHVPAAKNTRNSSRTVGRDVSSAVREVSNTQYVVK
jgi:hypothetical protein